MAVLAAAAALPPGSMGGASYALAADTSMVRVGLLVGGNAVDAGATCPFTVVDGRTGASVTSGAGSSAIGFRLAGGGVMAGNQGPFNLLVLKPTSASGLVTLGGKAYRGHLEIRVGTDGKLLVVNVVGLEAYLRGVVAREMISSWPAEALKSQAVAARTYAVAKVRDSQSSGALFAVTANTNSQVYGGVAGETPATDAAVAATSGLVLTYGGSPITAYYHASSGGHTENSENVWTAALPYLRGVPDFDQASPKYSWTRSFTPGEISYLLEQAGYKIGALTGIAPQGDRGVSGRWVKVCFTGSAGSAVVKGEQARSLLGLHSSLFDVEFVGEGIANLTTHVAYGADVVVAGAAAGQPVTALRKGGTNYSIGPEGVLYRMDSPAVIYRTGASGRVDFNGHGWGHGVGMSQWGAYQMAKDGKTFAEILAYYYQGATLEAR